MSTFTYSMGASWADMVEEELEMTAAVSDEAFAEEGELPVGDSDDAAEDPCLQEEAVEEEPYERAPWRSVPFVCGLDTIPEGMALEWIDSELDVEEGEGVEVEAVEEDGGLEVCCRHQD